MSGRLIGQGAQIHGIADGTTWAEAWKRYLPLSVLTLEEYVGNDRGTGLPV